MSKAKSILNLFDNLKKNKVITDQQGFDYKEVKAASDWQDKQEKKGRFVYVQDNNDDQFWLVAMSREATEEEMKSLKLSYFEADEDE